MGLRSFITIVSPEVHIITDHKPLVTILRKIHGNTITMHTAYPIKIHQYRVQILYKARPEISLQTGCHGTTTKKAKMNQSETWT